MDAPPTTNRWDWIYATRDLSAVGWYEPEPVTSLMLIRRAVDRGARTIIDVGGGGSFLVDHLVDFGLERIAVLDISEAGLATARHRLGARADNVDWMVGDLSTMSEIGHFDIWHDRAAFHFLLDPDERANYVDLAASTLPPHGIAIVATFADDGPERCSGMPVVRYDPATLARVFGDRFAPIDSLRHAHRTPAGVEQRFQYSVLERTVPETRSAGLA